MTVEKSVDNAKPSNESTTREAILQDIKKAVLIFTSTSVTMEKISKTSKATKLCKRSVERIDERGYVRASIRRKPKFGKVDEFWKNLI